MPTYEYRCAACEHEFEEFQSITAAPLKKCPACRKAKLQRLIGTGAGVIFKGSGFYETDYRSDSYKKAAEKDSSASKPADSSSATKSDSSASSSTTKTEAAPKAEAKPVTKSESKPAAKPSKPAKA